MKSNRKFAFVAAISYVIIHSAKSFFPEFEDPVRMAETILGFPMAFGEIGFAFWLIIQEGKTKILYQRQRSV